MTSPASLRVVLVEDDRLLLDALAEAFVSRGLTVLARATTLAEAVDAVDDTAPMSPCSTSGCRRGTPTRGCASPSCCASDIPPPQKLRDLARLPPDRRRHLVDAPPLPALGLAEEPAQPAETPAEVVDHEAASSSLAWHRPDPDDIPPARRGPS